MRDSLLSLFPAAEYEARLAKIVEQMHKNGVGALILTSDENTYYFSGFRSIVWCSKVSTPGVLVITDDGSTAIATTKGGAETVRVTSSVEDIRRFGTAEYPTYAQAIVSLLAEKDKLNGRVGMEFGTGHKIHLNYDMTQQLFAALKDATLVDAADMLWAVRSIKSPLEIQAIRKACDINCKGIERGFDRLRAGYTELELNSMIMEEYYRLGAESSLTLGIRAGAERYSQGNCPPSRRPIQPGEIILVDGGPSYDGYVSDIIREAVIGKPTDYQQEMFDVAREACYRGIDAMKPGTPIDQVVKVVDDFMDNSKFAEINVYKHWCGHSIGVGVHEYPMLDSDTHILLKPGMVFSIEPYIFQDNVGSLGIEENVLITETGAEILTPSDSHLRRL